MNFNEIATLRIELQDTDPVIWRQVEVPTSVTLKVLHDIIQAVMGWLNYHLWEFTIGKQRYGLPTNEDWGTESRIEASKVRLRDVLKSRKNVIDYLYDFGDSWEHRITVTNIRPAESGVSYPRYIAGEWNAPPEDSAAFRDSTQCSKPSPIPTTRTIPKPRSGSMNMTRRSSTSCPSNTPSAGSRTGVMLPRPASLTTSKPHQQLSSRNQLPRPSPDGYGNSKWGAGFLKVRLPSHSDRIADITEGSSRADTVEKVAG